MDSVTPRIEGHISCKAGNPPHWISDLTAFIRFRACTLCDRPFRIPDPSRALPG